MEREYTLAEVITTVCNYIVVSHKGTCQCPVCLAAMRLMNEIELTKLIAVKIKEDEE